VERIKTRCRLRSFHKSGKKIRYTKMVKNKKIYYMCIWGIFVSWDFFIEGTEINIYEVNVYVKVA